MATPTTISILGLADFEGETVTVFLAGLDCGEHIVQNAKVTLTYGVAHPYLTYRYLEQVTAYIRNSNYTIASDLVLPLEGGHFEAPVVVGYRYLSRGKRLPPIAPDQSGAQAGPAYGKLRRNNKAAYLLNNSQDFSIGTDFDKLAPADIRTEGQERTLSPIELISAMHKAPVNDDYTFDGGLAWETSGPYPLEIVAVGGFIETEDE